MEIRLDTVGGRLKDAIERQLGSIRKFERRLKKEAPDLLGTSRQTLYRYFDADTEPGPGVLKAAAAVLGIREEWLASGQGKMTAEEQRAHAIAVAGTAEALIDVGRVFEMTGAKSTHERLHPQIKTLHEAVCQAVGRPIDDPLSPWLTGLIEVWLRLRKKDVGEDREGTITSALLAPLGAFGLDPAEMCEEDIYNFAFPCFCT